MSKTDYVLIHGQLYSENELKHFKYVHKEKKNGKWVYYYHHKTGRHTASTYTSDNMSKDGYGTFKRSGGTSGQPDEVVKREKSNDLFSTRSRFTVTTSVNKGRDKVTKYTTYKVGRLEQTYDKFKKKVSSLFSKLFGG